MEKCFISDMTHGKKKKNFELLPAGQSITIVTNIPLDLLSVYG